MSTTTNPVFKLFFSFFSECHTSHKNYFTDGSLSEDGVAAAAVSSKQHRKPYTLLTTDLQLLQNPMSFLFLFFCLFVCLFVFCSAHLKESSFLVLSDSVPSLQAMLNKKFSHPILINIYDISGFDSR